MNRSRSATIALLSLLWLAGIAGPGNSALGAQKTGKRPPNVVIFLADDMGYSDLGCYGGEIRTPNLDRLAAGGVRFTQFYNTARCWPSRAALLSGYYAQQVNRDPAANRPKWASLMPELLRPAGYRSYHSGKWHVDGPVLASGFARSYELLDHNRNFSPLWHNLDDKPLPAVKLGEPYYSSTAIAGHAIDWLNEHEAKAKDAPFLLYVAFTSPHFPVQAPEADIARYRGKYADGWDAIRDRRLKRQAELGVYTGNLSKPAPEIIPKWNVSEAELKAKISEGEVGHAVPWKSLTAEQQAFQAEKMAVHAAMVDRMDQEIGRVLDRIKATGKFDDTIVLFASDNGASAEQLIRGDGHKRGAATGSAESFVCLGPGWSMAANTPFRLHKYYNHEGGISTPLIVHWPAGIAVKGGLRKTPGHLIDIVPTLLELAGLEAPSTHKGEHRPDLPGKSLIPAFAGDVPIARDFLFFKHDGNRALRSGNWKIVARGPQAPWELYDLANDRGEVTNLAAKQPAKLKKLADRWAKADAEYAKQGATGTKPERE